MNERRLIRFLKIMEMRREEQGLSHNKLAEKAGLSDPSHSHKLVRGKIRNPSVTTISKLKAALKMTEEEWRWIFDVDLSATTAVTQPEPAPTPSILPREDPTSLADWLAECRKLRKQEARNTDRTLKDHMIFFDLGLRHYSSDESPIFAEFELEVSKAKYILSKRDNLEDREEFLQGTKHLLLSAQLKIDKDTDPLIWADIQNYLGIIEMELGLCYEKEDRDKSFRRAKSFISTAKSTRVEIKNEIGEAHSLLFEGIVTLESGIRDQNFEAVGIGVQLFRDAESKYRKNNRETDSNYATGELARALMEQSVLTDEDSIAIHLLGEDALRLFNTAISFEWSQGNIFRYAELQLDCGKVFELLGELERENLPSHYRDAFERYKDAMSHFNEDGTPVQYSIGTRRLKRLRKKMDSVPN